MTLSYLLWPIPSAFSLSFSTYAFNCRRSSMDESSVGSKFDGRIVPRIEVRRTNRASNGSSLDESFLGSKFDGRIVPRIEVRWTNGSSDGRLAVRWANRTSDRSSMDDSQFDGRTSTAIIVHRILSRMAFHTVLT